MVAGFVIGVDGGGTRSRAVAVSIEGERLGEVNGGPLNVNTTETGTFTESLDGLFQQFRDLHRLDASAAVQTVIGTASLFVSTTAVTCLCRGTRMTTAMGNALARSSKAMSTRTH